VTPVEVVEALYDAMAARDFDGLFALVDPDVVITQDPRLPWGGRFEGHDGLARFAMALTETIDSRVAISALYATDTEVIQYGRTSGRVRANEAWFDVPEMHRWQVRDGRAVAAHFSIDTEAMVEALAAPAESCPDCGFVWADVPAADVGSRAVRGSAALATALRDAPAGAAVRRPGPDVWSALEYGAHLRDVLVNLRDRLVVGLAEDTPSFKPLYRDLRVDAGLYQDEEPDIVATELTLVADLFARTFAHLTPEQLARPVVYAYPSEQTRTILWMGRQVVHEVEHHLDDVRGCLTA
jgi:ketosteroid isomerase-like protein